MVNRDRLTIVDDDDTYENLSLEEINEILSNGKPLYEIIESMSNTLDLLSRWSLKPHEISYDDSSDEE